MADKEDDSKTTFRVNDRRRFDNDGNERTEAPSSGTDSSGSKKIAEIEAKTVEPKASLDANKPLPEVEIGDTSTQGFTMSESEGDEDGGGIDFSSFVMSLATQALVQLGEMRPPSGMEIPIDPEAAQQTIEILSMLARKTKGNLSTVEAKLLEDILHNLRISYVSALR